MNLQNFKKHIDSTIFRRGKDVYEGGAVMDLKESKPGVWAAKVMGSRLYKVKVVLKEEEITRSGCSCPFDYGPVCKHEVAVLMELRDREEKVGSEKQTLPDDEILALGKELDKADLLQFIIDASDRHRGLREEFRLRFAEVKVEEDQELDYHQMLQDAAEYTPSNWQHEDFRYEDYGYGDDFIDEEGLEEALEKLLGLAQLAWEKGDVDELMCIVEAVFEEVPPLMRKIEEDPGGIVEGLEGILALVELVAGSDKVAWVEIAENFLIAQVFSKADRGWGVYLKAWEVVERLTLSKVAAQKLMDGMKERISKEVKGDSGHFWEANRWIDRACELLPVYFPETDERDFLEQYIFVDGVRKRIVKTEIEAGRYFQATKLLREALQKEANQPHSRNFKVWQELLLEIAGLDDDDAGMRVLSDQLFFDGRHYNFQYYDSLKAAYANKDWPAKVEKILDQIGPSKSKLLGIEDRHRAEVLHREGYSERLLEHLRNWQPSYHDMVKFVPKLKQKYPQEVIALLSAGIWAASGATGDRKHYRKLAAKIRSLDKIKGGKATRIAMVKQMRINYARRSAMLEVFLKEFGAG
jgi:hypothetical protein